MAIVPSHCASHCNSTWLGWPLRQLKEPEIEYGGPRKKLGGPRRELRGLFKKLGNLIDANVQKLPLLLHFSESSCKLCHSLLIGEDASLERERNKVMYMYGQFV